MKKLLHIAFAGGGVDVAVRLINENLSPNDYLISVIREVEHEGYVDRFGQKIKSFVVQGKREVSISDISSFFKLLRLVKKESPDIIHVHSAKAGILGRIVAQVLGIKVFYTPHAFSYLSSSNLIKRRVYLVIEKIVRFLTPGSEIIACSMSEYNRAIQDVGYSESCVKLFNNSISKIENKNLDNTLDHELNKKFLCTIGRPSFQKNLIRMLEIIKSLKDTRRSVNLLVLGVGYYSPDLQKIEEYIEQNNLKELVKLYPWVERKQALSILSKAFVYISTARYEGLPLSVIESMALGVPVVASNVDGNRDLVIDGETGYLIDDMDVEKFSARINSLLNDEELWMKMSEKSKEIYAKRFNIDDNILVLNEIYSKNQTKLY